MDAFTETLGMGPGTLIIFSGICLINFYDQVIEGNMSWIDILIKVTIIMAAITFLTVTYI